MISFSPDLSNLTKFANIFSNAGGRSTQSFSKVDVQTHTQTGLSIVTAEGDKVTLSTNAAFQGTGVKYNARGLVEGQAVTLRSNSLEGSLTSEKQITLEGNLNEQEIQDIKKIINQVNGLREDVATGDLNTILANGQQIKASGSIASVDLNIKHSEFLSVQQGFSTRGPKPEQPVYPSGTIPNESLESANATISTLGFLEGILNSIGQKTRFDRDAHNTEISALPETSASERSFNQKSENFLPRLLEDIVSLTKEVGQSRESLSENILERAGKIATLAEKLNKALESTTARIGKDTQKISTLLSEGKFEEAQRLQQSTDRRVNRLGKTTQRMSDRIERNTDRLTEEVESLSDRLQKGGALTENFPNQGSRDQPEEVQTAEPQLESKTTANV